MNIIYTEEKKFTQEQVQKLFLSVGWVSGQYPKRLHKALMNSSTVITAWDANRLGDWCVCWTTAKWLPICTMY